RHRLKIFARFYKEELARETATYIHTRAVAEARSAFNVLASSKEKLCAASRNIQEALAGDLIVVETWRMFEHGVM
ncbi:hypothetical protein H0H92_005734, partial [Tricholoma furcatifolium]